MLLETEDQVESCMNVECVVNVKFQYIYISHYQGFVENHLELETPLIMEETWKHVCIPSRALEL